MQVFQDRSDVITLTYIYIYVYIYIYIYIDKLEKIQRRAIRMVEGLGGIVMRTG